MDISDLWRAGKGRFNPFEIAGEFNRTFGKDFRGERVDPDEVSFGPGNTRIAVALDHAEDEWYAEVIHNGETLERIDIIENFDDIGAFLSIAKELWDTRIRPIAFDWIDEGGRTASGSSGERWAYRLVHTPLTVFYNDPVGWYVGSGRNPREASLNCIHGPWQNIDDAKRFAERWSELDHQWVAFYEEGYPITIITKEIQATCIKEQDGKWTCTGYKVPIDPVKADDPLTAIQMWEAEYLRLQAPTKLGEERKPDLKPQGSFDL